MSIELAGELKFVCAGGLGSTADLALTNLREDLVKIIGRVQKCSDTVSQRFVSVRRQSFEILVQLDRHRAETSLVVSLLQLLGPIVDRRFARLCRWRRGFRCRLARRDAHDLVDPARDRFSAGLHTGIGGIAKTVMPVPNRPLVKITRHAADVLNQLLALHLRIGRRLRRRWFCRRRARLTGTPCKLRINRRAYPGVSRRAGEDALHIGQLFIGQLAHARDDVYRVLFRDLTYPRTGVCQPATSFVARFIDRKRFNRRRCGLRRGFWRQRRLGRGWRFRVPTLHFLHQRVDQIMVRWVIRRGLSPLHFSLELLVAHRAQPRGVLFLGQRRRFNSPALLRWLPGLNHFAPLPLDLVERRVPGIFEIERFAVPGASCVNRPGFLYGVKGGLDDLLAPIGRDGLCGSDSFVEPAEIKVERWRPNRCGSFPWNSWWRRGSKLLPFPFEPV